MIAFDTDVLVEIFSGIGDSRNSASLLTICGLLRYVLFIV